MIRQDYSRLRPRRERIFLHKTREMINKTLLFIGVVLLFIASSETEPGTSIFWNLGFGVLGVAFIVLGFYFKSITNNRNLNL